MVGIEKIGPFDIKANAPVEIRMYALNQADRLSKKWVHKSILCFQEDTGVWHQCLVNAATLDGTGGAYTEASDWKVFEGKAGSKVFLFEGVPDNAWLDNGDTYIDTLTFNIYYKEFDFWHLKGNFKGADAEELVIQWSADGTTNWGATPALYIRYSTDGGDTFSDAFRQQGLDGQSGDRYKTTSTSTHDIQIETKTFTVDTDLAYTPNQAVLIVSAADISNYMEATVTAYSSNQLNVSVTAIGGTGQFSDWIINLAGATGGDGKSAEISYSANNTDWHSGLNPSDLYIRFRIDGGTWSDGRKFVGQNGEKGKAFTVDFFGDLTDAKVDEIQGGSWSDINPYVVHVKNDLRTGAKIISMGIGSPLAGYAIAYSGLWKNYGLFRGAQGLSPSHTWNGTALRFQNPDGSWGSYVDLKGSTGVPGPGYATVTDNGLVDTGRSFTLNAVHGAESKTLIAPKGPTGNKPSHQWSGPSLRFQNSDDSWGDYVNLKGLSGDVKSEVLGVKTELFDYQPSPDYKVFNLYFSPNQVLDFTTYRILAPYHDTVLSVYKASNGGELRLTFDKVFEFNGSQRPAGTLINIGGSNTLYGATFGYIANPGYWYCVATHNVLSDTVETGRLFFETGARTYFNGSSTTLGTTQTEVGSLVVTNDFSTSKTFRVAFYIGLSAASNNNHVLMELRTTSGVTIGLATTFVYNVRIFNAWEVKPIYGHITIGGGQSFTIKGYAHSVYNGNALRSNTAYMTAELMN
jgi:hypothetical protein